MARLADIAVTVSERAWAHVLRMIADGIDLGTLNPVRISVDNNLRTGVLTLSACINEIEMTAITHTETPTAAEAPLSVSTQVALEPAEAPQGEPDHKQGPALADETAVGEELAEDGSDDDSSAE